MKNNLKLLLILLTFLTQLSCERDEICLEDITPKLIIRFYNENIPNEFKSVALLKVNIEGIDGDYSNEEIQKFQDYTDLFSLEPRVLRITFICWDWAILLNICDAGVNQINIPSKAGRL